MASGGYRPAMGVDQYLATEVATQGTPGVRKELQVGTDFPIVCETCLGPNPYVRMIKVRFGEKLCKVSNVPMQSFRWKAGPGGRFKETIVCREVAVEKNICQACLTDMTFGVPVGVRDALLRSGGAGADGGGYVEALSNANQAHYYNQRRAEIDAGGTSVGAASRLEPSRELLQLARRIEGANKKSVGTAFRNLPKICSFWMAGTCTRVLKGTCPFRPCCGIFKFPELARNHREECAALVADLTANGAAKAMATTPDRTRQLINEAISVNKEEAIRNRAAGRDDSATYYASKQKEVKQLEKPKDPSCTTLWVGRVTQGAFTERDFVDAFYSFGQIRGVRIAGASAFVEFEDRAAAEAAADATYRNLVVKGESLPVDWAKPRGESRGAIAAANAPLPPPNAAGHGLAPAALPAHLQQALGAWGHQGPAGPPPPPGAAGGDAAAAAAGPPRKKPRPAHLDYPSMAPDYFGSVPKGPPGRGPPR